MTLMMIRAFFLAAAFSYSCNGMKNNVPNDGQFKRKIKFILNDISRLDLKKSFSEIFLPSAASEEGLKGKLTAFLSDSKYFSEISKNYQGVTHKIPSKNKHNNFVVGIIPYLKDCLLLCYSDMTFALWDYVSGEGVDRKLSISQDDENFDWPKMITFFRLSDKIFVSWARTFPKNYAGEKCYIYIWRLKDDYTFECIIEFSPELIPGIYNVQRVNDSKFKVTHKGGACSFYNNNGECLRTIYHGNDLHNALNTTKTITSNSTSSYKDLILDDVHHAQLSEMQDETKGFFIPFEIIDTALDIDNGLEFLLLVVLQNYSCQEKITLHNDWQGVFNDLPDRWRKKFNARVN